MTNEDAKAGREAKAFPCPGGAMNFAVEILAKRQLDEIRIEIVDEAGQVLFDHDEIASARRQIRS